LKGKKRPDLAILNKKRAKWSAQKLRPILEDFANSPYALRDYVVRKKIGMNAQNLGGLFRKYLPEEYALVAERKKCRNKSYRKGRHFEWRVRDDFRAKGYFVLRSPRSAGPVDLVAIKKGDVVLIQCKVHYKTFKAKERKELGELAESIGARAIFAYRNSIDWSIRYETVFLPILITPMRNP
jgi:Holliday junction resolvase